MSVRVYVYMCEYVYVCVCAHVCMYKIPSQLTRNFSNYVQRGNANMGF